MLTTTPHLLIRRPSPTTAEFTVTTCPRPTIPLRLALLGVFLARIAAVLAVGVSLYSRWWAPPTSSSTTSPSPTQHQQPPPHQKEWQWSLDPSDILHGLLSTLHSTSLGQRLAELITPLPSWTLVAFSLFISYLALLGNIHTTESLLVLRGLGIQTASGGSSPTATTWSGRRKLLGSSGLLSWGAFGTQTRFIPTEKIRDVLINEAFRGFEVRYYLVVVVEGEEDVVVVFPRLLPRRGIVETVWRGARECLYEPGDHGGLGGSLSGLGSFMKIKEGG